MESTARVLPIGLAVTPRIGSDELESACARVAHALRLAGTAEDVVAAAISAIKDVPARTKFNVPPESLVSGVKLDVGCGFNKQPGFIGMDWRDLPDVDVVHDAAHMPWPFPDGSCRDVAFCHVLEHFDPRIIVDLINEAWRVLEPNGLLHIATPYANSMPAYQDPTHVRPGFTETCFDYFCPEVENQYGERVKNPLYDVYRPRPFKRVHLEFNPQTHVNVVLQAQKRTPENGGNLVKLQVS